MSISISRYGYTFKLDGVLLASLPSGELSNWGRGSQATLVLGDFDGWFEQRGSRFLCSWDPSYVPLVELADPGRAPQRGVFLSAPCGAGRVTYVALALHRQLPEVIPGAYRILANLISA